MGDTMKEMVVFELENDVSLITGPSVNVDHLLAAFMLLGGMVYQCLIDVPEPDPKKIRKMFEEQFEIMKNGDFSQLAPKIKRVVKVQNGVPVAEKTRRKKASEA